MKIRSKFILIVTPLFISALVAVFAFNVAIFKSDKIAYVFATTLENTKAESEVVEAEVRARRPLFELYTASFDFAQKKFSPFLKGQLQTNETVQYLEIAERNGTRLDSVGYLSTDLGPDFQLIRQALGSSSSAANKTEIRFFKARKDLWVVVQPIAVKGYIPENYLAIAVFKNSPFKDLINKPRSFDLFLVDKSGHLLSEPEEAVNDLSGQLVQKKLSDIIDKKSSSTQEISYEKNQFLVAWSPTAETNLGFIAVTSKSKATSAIQKMFKTSLGLLFILIAIGLIVILVMTTRLTNGIELLTNCMTLFSSGKMDIKSRIKSKDEVGVMSKVFNQMTDKIVDLVQQTADKARMESELDTAKSVQKRFLPQPQIENDWFKIIGFYEPASECGGDWWFHTHDENSCLLMIGDVTGHGVGSALLTSSLRAGVAALRASPDMPLKEYVSTLNRVIYDTAQGNQMATFFVAKLNLLTGDLEYVNASHNPPLVRVRQDSGEYENVFLHEISGSRLGEKYNSTYTSHSIRITENSLLFCFTDGLLEFQNEKGRIFGERKTYKAIERSFQEPYEPEKCQINLLEEFSAFRKERPLDDDLTFCFLHFRKNKPDQQGHSLGNSERL